MSRLSPYDQRIAGLAQQKRQCKCEVDPCIHSLAVEILRLRERLKNEVFTPAQEDRIRVLIDCEAVMHMRTGR